MLGGIILGGFIGCMIGAVFAVWLQDGLKRDKPEAKKIKKFLDYFTDDKI